MKEIGEQLRAGRQAKGITLDEIQAETKIGRAYLVALEEGDFDRLPPGDPYIKGFIRSYSRVVDCDPEPLIAIYNERKSQEVESYAYTSNHTSKGRSFLSRLNQTLNWFDL